MINLSEIIAALSPSRPGSIDKTITQAVVDSRDAVENCLFVAIKGSNTDGHDYVGNALKQGAIAALIEHPLADPSLDVIMVDTRSMVTEETINAIRQSDKPVCFLVNNSVEALQRLASFIRIRSNAKFIGITGTFGKTTTKELIAQVLGSSYKTQKSEGNHNNEIGLPLSMIALKPDTEMMVLEMGFYVPGEIKLLCDIAHPSVGVLTNIGAVHAERAGSLETIAKGKGELVEALPPSPEGVAILNDDDPFIRKFDKRTLAKVFRYGSAPTCDLWASDLKSDGLNGIKLTLHYGSEVRTVKSSLLGEHSMYTVLRAAATGLVCGLSLKTIATALDQRSDQLRLTPKKLGNGTLIIDDSYNAGPESTIAALKLLSEIPGRHIAILGDMLELGQYEFDGHQRVGETAATCVDELFTFGERARAIEASAKDHGLEKIQSFGQEQIDLLIANLLSHIQGNEVILVKGSFGMGMKRVVTALETML